MVGAPWGRCSVWWFTVWQVHRMVATMWYLAFQPLLTEPARKRRVFNKMPSPLTLRSSKINSPHFFDAPALFLQGLDALPLVTTWIIAVTHGVDL